MGNVAVRVEGLGKMYRIGGKQERYRTLRDSLTDAVSAPFKRARSLMHGQAYGAAGLNEEIWALKDVSFEVHHGEVVGIIGRNGAGKSTLLKILSRITEPTEGYADVYGRVGSLLEVGTGFHPELTGRENIYLNGAILGMGRAEIDRKFDEIVDFAEVERFIDTPVKHYSSGMGLRLGFAVAAHLEPEILVVDEVLAVGDAQFQKKCLGKMSDVASEGRTVLFVSHNMAAVNQLTGRSVLLDQGCLRFEGVTGDVVQEYLSATKSAAFYDLTEQSLRTHAKRPVLTSLSFLDDQGLPCSSISSSRDVVIEIGYCLDEERAIDMAIAFFDSTGYRVFTVTSLQETGRYTAIGGTGTFRCIIRNLNLVEGRYYLKLGLWEAGGAIDIIENAGAIDVVSADIFGTGRRPKRLHGVCVFRSDWEIKVE